MGFWINNFDNEEGNGDKEIRKTAIICIVGGVILILLTFMIMGRI